MAGRQRGPAPGQCAAGRRGERSHRTQPLSLTEAGPFAFLLQLEPGTKLFVLKENGGIIPFSVIRSESVAAENISGLETIVDQFENALALVTCENERPSGGYADCRVVIAVPD